jgi:fibrillarin-like pre-rRNA processing protein
MPRKPVSLGWGVRREGRTLWSRNSTRGKSVGGERRKRDGKIEWRRWDPFRSKVAAALLMTSQKASELLPSPGDTCLYLGASSGTTVSHIHDMVCGSNNHHNGQIIAVEISPRMMRDLSSLAEDRSGLIPILNDARETQSYAPVMREKAHWIHQDLSIADQAENFISIATRTLKNGGIGLLSLKAASERQFEGDDQSRFSRAEKLIEESELELIEKIDISQYQEQHMVFFVRLL